MSDTPRLRELKKRLEQLDKLIRDCKAERIVLRSEMAQERQKERVKKSEDGVALERQIIARWETGMSARDIARATNQDARQIERIIDVWRQREGVTIRRGHTIPERRSVKNGRSSS